MQAKELVVPKSIPVHIHNVTIVATQAAMVAEAGDKQWNIMKVM